jgi:hypothetical protein
LHHPDDNASFLGFAFYSEQFEKPRKFTLWIFVSPHIRGKILCHFFMNDTEMKDMLITYMGKGFLDNIIAMFRQDTSLYRFIADMLGDDNMRVRLGATALVEELAEGHRVELRAAVPGIINLLKHDNPTIRGDAASVLRYQGSGS